MADELCGRRKGGCLLPLVAIDFPQSPAFNDFRHRCSLSIAARPLLTALRQSTASSTDGIAHFVHCIKKARLAYLVGIYSDVIFFYFILQIITSCHYA